MIRTVSFSVNDGPEHSPRAALVEWLVGEGERIEAGSPLCSYEVDKAIATISSPFAGHVRRLLVAVGERFSRNAVLALVSDAPDEPLTEAPAVSNPDGDDGGGFDWNEIDNRGGDPEPLGVMRRTIALRMAMSKRHIPCFYLTATVDLAGCLALRAAMKREGRKATINDMVIKASALALAKHPKAAGVFVPAGVVPRSDLNIGFAAALPDDGLVVPVIKNADRKTLADIADETRGLAAKAKLGELTPEDCAGGVFSVSYLGSYDVDNFVAIVNPGEAAIAAVGKTVETPVVVDGKIEIRPMVKITLSCDHRSIDGALAARLMGDIKYFLERPEQL